MESDLPFNLAGQCFMGSHDKTVDSQRRVALPRPWRVQEEGDAFVLFPGRGGCLQLIPMAAFKPLFEKLLKVSFADPKAGPALANLAALAQQVVCDNQGRIAMTPALMAWAKLDKSAVLVGAFTTIQIWNPEAWQAAQMHPDRCLDVLQAIQDRPDDVTQILRNAMKG